MRILIKIGSALTKKGRGFNLELTKEKVEEISELNKEHEIILVTSGAISCGMEIENLDERPKETLKLQLLSGKGQIQLIKNYFELFENNGIKIAQVLLTHHNLSTDKEKETIKRIIEEYLTEKTIPIINENDLVSKEEIEKDNIFTDNDILSAMISSLLKVDLCLILTDVDGLYTKNPKKDSEAKLIEEIKDINSEIKEMASKETNNLGLGGMYSKIIAAEILKKQNIKTIIANGNKNIKKILENQEKRTLII
jgi:glutamate 5-kinase